MQHEEGCEARETAGEPPARTARRFWTFWSLTRSGEPRRRRARPAPARCRRTAAPRRRSRRRCRGRRSTRPAARAGRRALRTASRRLLGRRRRQRRAARAAGQDRLDRRRLQAERARRCRAAPAEARRARRATLRPMPSTAQRSCGRPSTRIPATFGRRPARRWAIDHARPGAHGSATRRLSRRPRPRRSAAAAAAARAARASTAARVRAARSSVRPWRPAAGGLLGGGDEGAVRRPGGRQLARRRVGRIGAAVGARAGCRAGQRRTGAHALMTVTRS